MRRLCFIGCVLFTLLTVFGTLLVDANPALKQTPTLDSGWESFQVASGICPQNRTTRSAPARYLKKKNPETDSPENIAKGKQLYYKDAKPTACGLCHGIRGNGNGRLARGLNPPPRNFTCAEVMESMSDGQLFWVIKNGSRGTAMPAHKATLSDKQIWQLIRFIREFAQTGKI
jgi:mono/diheme cytochrome c family protein